jgi:8-oxo-dGTP pyrophosphatase MutT (NUDIX family)
MTTTRDFTVAVFVVNEGRVLLHWHRKLQRWLPPGGHIEPNELPDEAAVREVMEETGVAATLRGGDDYVESLGDPRRLRRPAGIQLEPISPGHEHIDLIYFATGDPAAPMPDVGWYGPSQWAALPLTAEVISWCERALLDVGPRNVHNNAKAGD